MQTQARPVRAGILPRSSRLRAAARLGSLVPDTLAELEQDEAAKAGLARLLKDGQAALTREEAARRRRAISASDVPTFDALLASRGCAPLRHGAFQTLQVNLGLLCNQACSHCHVESSPLRTAENMDERTARRVLELLAASPSVRSLDLTGGAPELNPHFRTLVRGARALGVEVVDRCNLTVLFEPGQESLAAFLAQQRVRVVASLPCYTPETVDRQRGRGVFERSVAALRELNAVGYGMEGSGLVLELMYNPAGARLPPPAAQLEPAYRAELADLGIVFTRLLTLTNMPIKRFADRLAQSGEMEAYMRLLHSSFNAATAGGVMCTSLLSVGWDGALYSCDFNQQLALPLGARRTLWDIQALDELVGSPVRTDLHCLGCTAGQGSSCGGALA